MGCSEFSSLDSGTQAPVLMSPWALSPALRELTLEGPAYLAVVVEAPGKGSAFQLVRDLGSGEPFSGWNPQGIPGVLFLGLSFSFGPGCPTLWPLWDRHCTALGSRFINRKILNTRAWNQAGRVAPGSSVLKMSVDFWDSAHCILTRPTLTPGTLLGPVPAPCLLGTPAAYSPALPGLWICLPHLCGPSLPAVRLFGGSFMHSFAHFPLLGAGRCARFWDPRMDRSPPRCPSSPSEH